MIQKSQIFNPLKTFLTTRGLSTSPHRLYSNSFGAAGNLRVAPKIMANIPSFKLNNGKEIPVVSYAHYFHEKEEVLTKL